MAGKGFTVKKDWDNPRKHAMPAGTRVPAEVRLGSVLVAPATVLAPMAGVTDTVFRRFIRHASLFTAATKAAEEAPRAVGRDFSPGITPLKSTGPLGPEVCFSGSPLENRPVSKPFSTIETTITNAQSGCGLLIDPK